MTTLSAEAGFDLKDAQAVIDNVFEHLRSHDGFIVEKESNSATFNWRLGKGIATHDGDVVTLKVEAPTIMGIGTTKGVLADHLVAHSPELAGRIVWSGDGSDLTYPAQFCFVTVIETTHLTPHMQRIRFTGTDLGRYAGFDNIHMGLFLPREDDPDPQWPSVEPSGAVQLPSDDVLPLRKYTIRRIDVAGGTFDVDFVLHEDVGPGSDFAFRAKSGDVIGMAGNGGKSVPLDRDWYLLAGDETALPAIGRFLETLPETARGVALVEVADAAEEQSIDNKTGIEIRWLHRNGAAPGTTNLLPDTVRAVEFPSSGSSVFAWSACEFTAFKAIRAYIRRERKLKKNESLIVSYWRQGNRNDVEEEQDHD